MSQLADPDLSSAVQFQRSLGWLVLGQPGRRAAWEEPTLKALVRLFDLPPNWDSYGGRPTEPPCIWAAWDLLVSLLHDDSPAPTVVPTKNGGVQLEWHCNGIDLEIEIVEPGQWVVSFEAEGTGESWEKTGAVAPAEIVGFVDRLTNKEGGGRLPLTSTCSLEFVRGGVGLKAGSS